MFITPGVIGYTVYIYIYIYLGMAAWPLASKSDHQNYYMFSRKSQSKPSLCHCFWGKKPEVLVSLPNPGSGKWPLWNLNSSSRDPFSTSFPEICPFTYHPGASSISASTFGTTFGGFRGAGTSAWKKNYTAKLTNVDTKKGLFEKERRVCLPNTIFRGELFVLGGVNLSVFVGSLENGPSHIPIDLQGSWKTHGTPFGWGPGIKLNLKEKWSW